MCLKDPFSHVFLGEGRGRSVSRRSRSRRAHISRIKAIWRPSLNWSLAVTAVVTPQFIGLQRVYLEADWPFCAQYNHSSCHSVSALQLLLLPLPLLLLLSSSVARATLPLLNPLLPLFRFFLIFTNNMS